MELCKTRIRTQDRLFLLTWVVEPPSQPVFHYFIFTILKDVKRIYKVRLFQQLSDRIFKKEEKKNMKKRINGKLY